MDPASPWISALKNIALIVLLLAGGFAAATWLGMGHRQAAQVALSAVFCFTAIGHFAKTAEMAHMLPPSIPAPKTVILLSGVLELMLATLIWIPSFAKDAGVAICVFLACATPLNVYAAIQRVDFGGHGMGPLYLFVRLPLQCLLILWAYWFLVRSP